MSQHNLVWVSLPYACYGIEARNGIITSAPPIAHWMTSKSSSFVAQWLKHKGATTMVTPLPLTNSPTWRKVVL